MFKSDTSLKIDKVKYNNKLLSQKKFKLNNDH